MQRKAWFEFHDHRLYPGFLRDFVTDALQGIWNAMGFYSPIAPRLQRSIAESGAMRIVDLCSGGGGPWLRLAHDFRDGGTVYPPILLTDKYPSRSAIRNLRQGAIGSLSFHREPVNAMEIPADLTGFRTIFSTFHHFGPAEARAILKRAFEQHQGIGIFEVAKCDLRTVLGTVLVPLLALRLAPRIRPFRWSRIFWTYFFPIIPLTLWLDGMLSCLRSYSPADLLEMKSGLQSDDYHWEIGEERGGPVPITYLIGCPRAPAQGKAAGALSDEFLTVQMQRPALAGRGSESQPTTAPVPSFR